MADGIPGVGGAEDLASKVAPAATPDISGIITELGSFHERVTKESQRKALEAQTKFGAQRAAADVRAGVEKPTLREAGILNKYAEAFNKATVTVHSASVVSKTKTAIRNIRKQVLFDPNARGNELEVFESRAREHLTKMDSELRNLDPSGKLADQAGLDALDFMQRYSESFANERIEREITITKQLAIDTIKEETDDLLDQVRDTPFDAVFVAEVQQTLREKVMAQIDANTMDASRLSAEMTLANDRPLSEALQQQTRRLLGAGDFTKLSKLIEEVEAQPEGGNFDFINEESMRGAISAMKSARAGGSLNIKEAIVRQFDSMLQTGNPDPQVFVLRKDRGFEENLKIHAGSGGEAKNIESMGFRAGAMIAREFVFPVVQLGSTAAMKEMEQRLTTKGGDLTEFFDTRVDTELKGKILSFLRTSIKEGQRLERNDPMKRGLQIAQGVPPGSTPKLEIDYQDEAFRLVRESDQFREFTDEDFAAQLTPGSAVDEAILRQEIELVAEAGAKGMIAVARVSRGNTLQNMPAFSDEGLEALNASAAADMEAGNFGNAIRTLRLFSGVYDKLNPDLKFTAGNALMPELMMTLPMAEVNPSLAQEALQLAWEGKRIVDEGIPVWARSTLPDFTATVQRFGKAKLSAFETYTFNKGVVPVDFFKRIYLAAGSKSQAIDDAGKVADAEAGLEKIFADMSQPTRLPFNRSVMFPKSLSENPLAIKELRRQMSTRGAFDDGAVASGENLAFLLGTVNPFVERTQPGLAVRYSLANGSRWLLSDRVTPHGFLIKDFSVAPDITVEGEFSDLTAEFERSEEQIKKTTLDDFQLDFP